MRFLVIFLISFHSTSQIEIENQLLWEISGNGLEKESYLFGSLHSNDKRIFWLSDSVYYALNRVESIVLETDVFSLFDEHDVRVGKASLKYDKNGDPFTTSDQSSTTAYGNEDGMPQFLDAYFQQYCYNAGKHFSPLESMEFQLGLLSEIEIPDWSKMRLNSIFSSEERMIQEYLKGDIHELNELIKSNFEFIPNWYDKLIVDRNINMAKVMDSLMNKQSVFCAVGAGHLAGSTGLLELLKRRGYKVRKVTHFIGEEISKDKEEVTKLKHYNYYNDTLRFKVNFYGKPKTIRIDYEEFDFKLVYQDLGQGNTYAVEVYRRDNNTSIENLAFRHIPSPNLSPFKKYMFDNGDIYFEGIADAYPEGIYWSRILFAEDYFIVLKAYGGNKFMNSKRAQKFFSNVWFVD